MKQITSISRKRAEQLNTRRPIQVELPEWVIRVLELRVAEANEGVTDDLVDVSDVVEWSLVAPITMKDIPAYEAAIPGVSAALSKWLKTSMYDPSM
jgi:hypothetical protein